MTTQTQTQTTNRDPLILVIDGHSMVFRAWFALSRGGGLTNSAGEQTHGAYGFLRNLIATIREYSPTHIVVTFDTRAPTFRDELFDEYKAHRPPIDPELHKQIPMVENVLGAMKIPVFAIDGFEADDVVGTIVKKAESAGIRSLILTGDADQLQLVNDETKLLMYSGFGDTRVYDIDGVKDRYDGLGPEFVAEIKALEGDPSDNIPGIAKIGPKAARTVLNRFGHFDTLYANIDAIGEIPSKELRGAKSIMTRLRDGEKIAYDGLKLTTIVTDVPIDIDFAECRIGGYDRNDVVTALTNLGFGETIVRSIPSAEDAERGVFPLPTTGRAQGNFFSNGNVATVAKPATKSDGPLGKYSIVTSDEELQNLVNRLSNAEGFAYDTETNGTRAMQDEMVGMSFSNSDGEGWYIPIGHRSGEQIDRSRALETVAPLFADAKVPKAAHNANFDMMVLGQAGIEVNNAKFDTMIAASLCGHNRYGLKVLALELFRAEMTPITDLIGTGRKQITMSEVDIELAGPYAAADADFTHRLWRHFEAELDGHNARNVFETIEMPLLPVIVEMQRTGMVVETDMLKKFSAALGEEIAQIKQVANNLVGGRQFNIASSQQISAILIDEWNAPQTRKLKTGWSMNADALDRMRNTNGLDDRIYQLIDAVLSYREHAKLKSTYADALPKMVNPATGRVHSTFNQAGSATGRLASNDPNVQNIPVRTPLGRRVRDAFTTIYDSGWQLLSADYSQIELRILAHMSREPGLLESFHNGEDIHNATARSMYGVQDVTSDQRRIAKILNFGVIYGLGPHGVARQTDLTQQQGREFIDLYFGRYPGIRDFIEHQKQVAKMRGYAETLDGRRRYLPDLRSSNQGYRAAAERVAVNMPIQGTAADVIKIAMINIADELHRRGLESRMTAQVHDELIFEVAPGELEEITSLAHDMMPAAMSLEVPLLVDTKTGIRWGELE